MSAAMRLRKLRSMSGIELRTRLAAAAYRVYERRAIRTLSNSRTPRAYAPAGRSAAASSTTANPAPRFLPSVDDLGATRHILETRYQRGLDDSLIRAKRMLRGEFTLFGQTRQLGEQLDWHADPISGRRWPLVYHRDVPVGDRSRGPGDAKDVWELNRQQFLADLGKAWLVSGRDEYVTLVHRLVLSWIDSNPYALGVNWAGPLEVAYRALSWLWAYHLTSDRPMPDGTRAVWLRGFQDHGRFLFRHLELYESPFNHLIGESSVLYVLGTLFPEFHEAARWRAKGRHVLESRLHEQFYADGGSVEQATVYHHASLGFYLLAALVGRQNHEELCPAMWSALERAVGYSMHLTQPDGRIPALGDNDDARPFAFDVSDNWDFRHFLAVGSVLFRRSDFKAVAGTMPEDAFWLLGPQGLTRFDELPDEPRPRASGVLRTSGYAILRNGDRDYVCFDCGEQAGGLRTDNLASAAHGHADALAVVATLSGQPLLVDAGFYTYDGDRSWERHFRETAAHNTVRVDHLDQARHLEKMSWCQAPRVTLEDFQTGSAGSWAVGSHDGYARSAKGVRHRRTVWLRPGGYLIIYDEVIGRGEHTAEVVFQLQENLEAAVEDARLVLDGRFIVRWCASADRVSARLRRGEAGADGGWIAPRLGIRIPAARLVLTVAFSNSLRVLTTISDGHVWTPDLSTSRSGRSALVQKLSVGATTEVIVASAGLGVSTACYETDGTIGIWREESGRVVEATRIGGTFIRPATSGAQP